MKRLLIFLLTITLLTNCNEPTKKTAPISPDQIEYIIFGYYSGMGIGSGKHYSKMFKIIDNHLLFDTTDSFYRNKTGEIIFGDTASKEKYDETLIIRQNVFEFFVTTKDSVFGRPDDQDQGGTYFEVKSKGQVHKFEFDPYAENPPKEVDDMMGLLHSLFIKLDSYKN